jgi:hypothetical protein
MTVTVDLLAHVPGCEFSTVSYPNRENYDGKILDPGSVGQTLALLREHSPKPHLCGKIGRLQSREKTVAYL